MKTLTATCPKCDHQFGLNEVLTAEIASAVTKQSREEIVKRDAEITKLKKEKAAIAEEIRSEAKEKLDLEVKRSADEREKRVRSELDVKVGHLEKELEERAQKLQLAQRHELDLRKKISDVEERERTLDLEVERKISEHLVAAKEKLTKQIVEDFHRKDLEREHLIAELRKQLVEMKQKAEQGSQQVQGEVFEVEIGNLLREIFSEDLVEDVPTGVSGADLIQTVHSKSGQRVGRILYEVKQTKTFQPAWIEKLREDRNRLGAELAILVTTALPKGKTGAFLDQGIWIAEPPVAMAVARVARQSLLEVHRAVMVSNARQDKADVLYSYLTNPVFRQRLEAIVESFHQMREDLEREKRAISKCWKQRERQLDSVVDNLVHIYSDIQSVVGQKVLSIQRLELSSSEDIEVVAT